MSTQNINNLVELFFINYKKQKKDNILLTSLKDSSNYKIIQHTYKAVSYTHLRDQETKANRV